MSNTRIVLNRQSDLILTGATITAPVGLVKEDILDLISDLTALGLADEAEAIARAKGDNAIKSALAAAEVALNAAIVSGDEAVMNALNAYQASNDAALAAETASRIAGDSALQTELDAEEARALAAEQGLATDIEALEVEHAADVATLQANIDNEQSRAEAAELANANAIAAEKAARIAADAAEKTRAEAAEAALQAALNAMDAAYKLADNGLQSSIDSAQAQIDGILEGSTLDANSFAEIVSIINGIDTENDTAFASYVSLNNATVLANKEASESRDAQLAADLAAEVSRATAAEGVLSTDLSEEVARATAAEATITSDLATEISNRTAADTAFTNSLNNEISDRIAGDQTVQTNLDNEVTRATDAEGVLRTDLNTEISDRISAVSAEEAARIASDEKLTASLKKYVDGLKAADAELGVKLDAEIVRAQAADAEHDKKDAELTASLEKEIARAQAADAEHDKKDAEHDKKDAELTASLEKEIARAQAADAEHDKKDAELSTEISVERGRIDAILDGSNVDLDQFREIVTFVESIDLENDASLLSAVEKLNVNDKEISVKLEAEIKDRSIADAQLTSDLSKMDEKYDAAVSLLRSDMEAADLALEGQIADIISNVDVTAIDSFSEVVEKLELNDKAIVEYAYSLTPKMLDSQSGDGVTTNFNAAMVLWGTHIIFLNGLMQREGVDYTYVDTEVVFNEAPAMGNFIDIYGVSSDAQMKREASKTRF